MEQAEPADRYHEEAIKSGIGSSTITLQSMKSAFKPGQLIRFLKYTKDLIIYYNAAFKEMEKTWPLYGRHSEPPLTPEEWWLEVIRKCLLHAGAEQSGEYTCSLYPTY
jgi:hypothetical protein